MNQQQIIGSAFEYAHINNLSATITNDLQKLISLMAMYNRPANEINKMSDVINLLKEYHFTYTQSTLEKFISLHNNKK